MIQQVYPSPTLPPHPPPYTRTKRITPHTHRLLDKHVPLSASLHLGRQLRVLTSQHNAAFIVNDDISLAHILHADGVQLGQDDVSVASARAKLGDSAIVSVSAGNCTEAERAIQEGADYVGVGALFDTVAKRCGEAIGVDGLEEVVRCVRGGCLLWRLDWCMWGMRESVGGWARMGWLLLARL